MQFQTAIVAAIFAAAAQAGTIQIGSVAGRQYDARAVNVADNAVNINLCSTIGKCVVALAPTVVSCVAAAAEDGINPIADAACLATAINTKVNPPAACSGCF